MAQMHPPRFPYPQDPMKGAERRFFNACKEQLGDTWIVLYEQHWIGHRNGKKQSGEADFILLSADHGVFVVEVKGGQEIGVAEGEWYSVSHGDTTRKSIRNPFTQAADSKFVLWDFITSTCKQRLSGELGHMVVFPGHRQVGDMSPQARREIICDRDDMRDLTKTMERVSRYFAQRTAWTPADLNVVVEKLMPTFRLLGEQREKYDEFFDQLNQLTDIQLTAFAMLRNLRRLNVHGGAGTGKTILALHRAIELANEGMSVLYLCHSTPLAQYLRDELESRTQVDSRLVRIESEDEFLETGRDYPRTAMGSDEREEHFLKLAESEHWKFDALIIDEAQSVSSETAGLAMLLLRDHAPLYIFGDVHQTTIRLGESKLELGAGWGPPEQRSSALTVYGSADPVELNVNCRSSAQIAEFAHAVVQTSTRTLGSRFAEVEVRSANERDFGTEVASTVDQWIEKFNLLPAEIRVLIPEGWFPRELLLFGEQPFDELGFSYGEHAAVDWYGLNSGRADRLGGEYRMHSAFVSECEDISSDRPERLRQFLSFFLDLSQKNDSMRIRESYQFRPAESITPERRPILERYGYWSESPAYSSDWKDQHDEMVKSLRVVPCIPYVEMIGLEADAVVVVLPFVSKGSCPPGRHAYFAHAVYSMATRARALLTVIGEPEAVQLLRKLSSSPPFPRSMFNVD